jgi:hypothetical protein
VGSECRDTGLCAYSSFSQSTLGFVAVSLTAERLQCRFYNASGQCIYQAEIVQTCPVEATVAALQ